MKKNLLIISFLILLPIFILVVLPSLFISSRRGISNTLGDTLVPLTSLTSASFSFISDKDNLEAISLTLKNPSIQNNSRIIVDISSGTEERSAVFYGANVGDPSTILLKFPNFPFPSGQTFKVKISTDNDNSQSLYLVAGLNQTPLFESEYREPEFSQRIKENYTRQYNNIINRSPLFTIIYFSVVLFFSIFLLLRREK
jgi:hypothetical protein